MDYDSLFSGLDAGSDVWVYISHTPLTETQSKALIASLAEFSNGWSSHGRRVHAGYELVDAQMLVLGAWIEGGDISGCGIDKSLHLIDGFAAEHGFSWADSLSVIYRDTANSLHVVTRSEFRALVRNGSISANTVVVDSTIRVLSEIREGQLEKPASESWHSMVFKIPQLTVIQAS